MVSSFVAQDVNDGGLPYLGLLSRLRKANIPPPPPHVSGGGNEKGQARHKMTYEDTCDSAQLLVTFVF